MGKPGQRVSGDAKESDTDEKTEAKMANFLVCFWLRILYVSCMANQTILTAYPKFRQWFRLVLDGSVPSYCNWSGNSM